MNALNIILPTFLVLCSDGLPTVSFTEEPKDQVVPWKGHSELRCRVNHTSAVYSWLAVRYAPVDLHYSEGFLVPIQSDENAVESETEVTESLWCRPHSDGRLTIVYPGSPDLLPLHQGTTQNKFNNAHKSINAGPWLEGAYRCKVTIPGYGSLLSRWAQVRLSDLFLEPGVVGLSNQSPRQSHGSTPTDTMPSLGGGSYWPGEVVVLRCPVKAISEQPPIYRWYFASSDGSLMQPVGLDSPKSTTESVPEHFVATPLDDGRWLEIRLGRYVNAVESGVTLTETRTVRPAPSAINYSINLLAAAGFGEYFCKVEIPRTWATPNLPEGSQLNMTSPYIPVYMVSGSGGVGGATYNEHGNAASEPHPVWAITPDITARVDLPDPPTVHASLRLGSEGWSPTARSRSGVVELWRSVGSSLTLLCAANLRNQRSTGQDSEMDSYGWIQAARLNSRSSLPSLLSANEYQLQWFKDGLALVFNETDDGGHISLVGTGHLRIRTLKTEDTGIYECHVIRSVTERAYLKATVSLLVGEAPTPIELPSRSIIGHIQDEKNMSCEFSGWPRAQFTWIKNSEPVKNSQYFRIGSLQVRPDLAKSGRPQEQIYGTELSIRGLLPNDEGYFQCVAENRFGSAQATFALRIQPSLFFGHNGPTDASQPIILPAPSNALVQGLGDTQAYITWTPPEPNLINDLENTIGYKIRIRTPDAPHGLTLNTTKPGLLLADLHPDSIYNVEIFTVRMDDGSQSTESAEIRFRTKSLVYRAGAVTDLTAEAGDFRTLVLSWRPPLSVSNPHSALTTEEISHYRITMFNLKPDTRTDPRDAQAKPILLTLPVRELQRNGDRFTHVVHDLSPDAFYQISVQAVTADNTTGYPAVLSSSARVASRPPSEPPTQVRVRDIGARVATVTWQPPPEGSRNGELILYRINISCDEWLRPRHINVLNDLSQLIRGLSRATKYELTVAAVTRAGNGPDSAVVAFTTMAEENEADHKVAQSSEGYVLHGDEVTSSFEIDYPKASMTGLKTTSTARSVENLRFIGDERSLLLLWSPPVTGLIRDGIAKPSELDHYLIKWGQLYPGPESAKIAANQTRFVIENLDADTPYMIEILAIHKNNEAASAMITGRTKPVQFRHRILIPLNLQVSSVDSDGAVIMWDEPRCAPKSASSSNSVECMSNELTKSYQVAYRMIGIREHKPSSTDSTTLIEDLLASNVDESTSNSKLDSTTHILNVSHTAVRLENLQAGRRYSVMVRTVGKLPVATNIADVLTSEWSMEQVFETPEKKPGDAPNDVSITALPLPPGDGPVSVQVAWQPPLRPHGRLVGYVLYYTADPHLPLVKWSKRKLPADSLNTVLSGLARGLIYFIQLRARNEHGNGPLSAISLYRTPDAFGQGGGRIPLGRVYHNATTIPSEFLNFGQKILNGASVASDAAAASDPARNGLQSTDQAFQRTYNTSILVVGSVIGAGLLALVILCGLIWWRRQRGQFLPVLGYKTTGPHVDGLPVSDGPRILPKTGSVGSHGTKRIRGMTYPQQDIALLVSNGEALGTVAATAVNPCSPQTLSVQPHSALPMDQLTTSVQLSTGGGVMNNVANASHAALLQQQLQQHARRPSWDRDSDSLPFASLSQQRQPDGLMAAGLFDLHGSNSTPTRTGSASTNSGPGSVCTPTRMTGNPTYQTHGNLAYPVETGKAAFSYASASLGSTSANAPMILPRSPLNQYQLVSSSYMTGGADASGAMMQNGTMAAVSSSGGLLMPSYYPTPPTYIVTQAMHGSAGAGQPMFYTGHNHLNAAIGAQTLPFSVISTQYLTNNAMNMNTPRVNAADLMSFTSSDDIRPVMSTSAHNEAGSSLDEASTVVHQSSATYKHATQPATNDLQPRSTHPHPRTPSHKPDLSEEHQRTSSLASPSRNLSGVATTISNPSSVRSPKRRPPQNAKSNQSRIPPESPLVQNGQDSSVQRESVNGDGAEDGMNKAFSTEELSKEMANLEGLMKDLSAITREEFNC